MVQQGAWLALSFAKPKSFGFSATNSLTMESAMFFKNLQFLKNACKGILFNADSPYLGSLTIFVWVMPVSILLFALDVQPPLLAVMLSVASGGLVFWYQATRTRLRMVASQVKRS
jgi:hypothetical protein